MIELCAVTTAQFDEEKGDQARSTIQSERRVTLQHSLDDLFKEAESPSLSERIAKQGPPHTAT